MMEERLVRKIPDRSKDATDAADATDAKQHRKGNEWQQIGAEKHRKAADRHIEATERCRKA